VNNDTINTSSTTVTNTASRVLSRRVAATAQTNLAYFVHFVCYRRLLMSPATAKMRQIF